MHRTLRKIATTAAAVTMSLGSLLAIAPDAAHADEPSLLAENVVTHDATDADVLPPAPDPAVPAPNSDASAVTLASVGDLGLDFRCGSTVGSGTIGVPALVGSCLFETVPSTAPTTAGVLQLEVVVTPTAAFYNQVVALGYGGYNVGVRLDAALGSPLRMVFSISPVSLTTGLTICNGTAGMVLSIPTGASRIRSIEGSKGSGVVSSYDPVTVSAPFSYSQTSANVSVQFDVCSSSKKIAVWLPTGIASINGKYNSYTFSFTGVPTYLAVTFAEVSSSTKRLSISRASSTMNGTVSFGGYTLNVSGLPTSLTATFEDWGSTKHVNLSHNASNMSGSVGLGSFGSATFSNAPRAFDMWIYKDGSGDLSYFSATASDAPGSGTNVGYNGSVAGISIHLDIRAISSISVVADMTNKRFSGDLSFMNRNGWIDLDVTGSWKGIGYNVQLDGWGLGHVFLGAGTSSPNIDFHALLRDCFWGCGHIGAKVTATFFTSYDVGTAFNIDRLSDGRYYLDIPLHLNMTVDENTYWSVLLGHVYVGTW